MATQQPARRNIHPDQLYRRVVGGKLLYTPVVAVSADHARLVYVSGQLSRDVEGRIVGRGDMAAQIRQVGENLRIALDAAGATLEDLVQTTTYVTDIDAFFRCADVRMEYFGPGMPTSTTVEVARLSHPDFLVEVEAVAFIHGTRSKGG